MKQNNLIEVRNVTKRYGETMALKGVSIQVAHGTVHGLLGENGAGKSTLVRVIAGLVPPSSGVVTFEGRQVGAADVRSMERRGVFLVPQEPMIVDPMTVADNLMLGRWPGRRGFVRQAEMERMAGEFLQEAHLDPRRIAGTLSAVEKRKLNILRALHSGGKLIILDEPTTALTMADKVQLFDFMRRLRGQGVSFLFISHYNEEILEICDEVTVLRDGQIISSGESVSHLDSDALSERVIGRDVRVFRRQAPATPGRVAWRFTGVQGHRLKVGALELREGEILGLAGLPGSGASEFARAIYGLLPVSSGEMANDAGRHPFPQTPCEALDLGIAFLSEDRLRDGIVGIQSVAQNMTLSSLPRLSRFGWMQAGAERALVERFSRLFSIKAASVEAPVASLSGGNQQKVLLSRLVATRPRLVILNEPTRGIDVGVKEEVHRLVDELTREGVSVIVVTSDLDEMLRVVDRVAFFVDGAITEVRPSAGLSKDDVFLAAFSADEPSRSPVSPRQDIATGVPA